MKHLQKLFIGKPFKKINDNFFKKIIERKKNTVEIMLKIHLEGSARVGWFSTSVSDQLIAGVLMEAEKKGGEFRESGAKESALAAGVIPGKVPYQWVMARFLEHGRVIDTFAFFNIKEISEYLPKLQLSPHALKKWNRMLEVYG